MFKKQPDNIKNSYVYVHKRIDNGDVFYVGIGVYRKDNKYARAFKTSRSIFWKNVASKTGYDVVITNDFLTWKDACLIEKELISHFGRKNLGLGTLVNLTNGGEGSVGRVFKHTEESKRKIGLNTRRRYGVENNMFGRKFTDEEKRILSENNKKYRHTKEAKIKISKASTGRVHTEVSKLKISNSNKGKIRTQQMLLNLSLAHKGYKHTEERRKKNSLANQGSNHSMAKLNEGHVLSIRKLYSMGIKTKKELQEKYNVSIHTIRNILNRKSWTHI